MSIYSHENALNYALVRYKQDVVSGECMNVGVIVFAPTQHFFQARLSSKYRRLSNAFVNFDSAHYRNVIAKLRQGFTRIEEQFRKQATELPFENTPRALSEIISTVLPPNDTAFQIDVVGGGLSANLDDTVKALFERFVLRNTPHKERENKTDDDVWKTFEQVFREQNILQYLHSKTISTPEIDVEFTHCWKNGTYRAYQPLSLDLQEAHSIEDKVFKWYGKLAALAEASEEVHVSFLVGLPDDEALREKAMRNVGFMKKSALQPEIIYEEGRYSLAEAVAAEMREHKVSERE
jgi:hypothetical protein